MSFIESIINNPIWQTFWIIAMIVAFFWFTQKNDRKALQIIIVSTSFWALHFLSIWLYSAFAVTIVGIFRVFLSLKYKRNKRVFYWIVSVTIILWIITYENTLSLLPIIWSCISAYGYFFFERVRLRWFMLITSMFWFTFHLNHSSIWWMINEVVVQTVIIIAMYKMIHEEWKRVFFIDKVMDIIKHPYPDVWRFINIYDIIDLKKKSLYKRIKEKIINIKKTIKRKA